MTDSIVRREVAERWVIYCLVAEVVFIPLAVFFSFALLFPSAVAAIGAIGLGFYLHRSHGRRKWLLASLVAILIPVWLVVGTIAGLG